MSWDESLVDYTSPYDGRITLAVGGATGDLRLLNGQTLTLPWKRQEQIPNTHPATLFVYDAPTVEYLEVSGPSIKAGATYSRLLLAGYDDGTNAVILNGGGKQFVVASGLVYADAPIWATSFSGPELTDTLVTSQAGYDVNLTSDTEIDLTSTGIIDINATGAITVDSDADITITTSGVGDDLIANIKGAITLTATGTSAAALVANGSQASIKGTAALVESTVGDVSLTTVTNGTLSVDNVLGAWTDLTTAWMQSATISKTTTYSRYKKIGRTVHFQCYHSATSSGTASNKVTIGLPTAAAQGALVVGQFYLYDASVGNNRVCAAALDTVTSVSGLIDAGNNYFGATGSGFTDAIGSGDAILVNITYEAAS